MGQAPTPRFPPMADQRFRMVVKGQDLERAAEGFRMTFDAPGSVYLIDLTPPDEAVHGPVFINFYASFYHKGMGDSIVECGLSFSGRKQWNFFANQGGRQTDHQVVKPTGRQQLEIRFHRDGSRKGLIDCRLGSARMAAVHLDRFRSVDYMRLVVAAGSREGASFSEVDMRLRSVDGKAPARAGRLEFMSGERINVANHRIRLLTQGNNGYSCALPAK